MSGVNLCEVLVERLMLSVETRTQGNWCPLRSRRCICKDLWCHKLYFSAWDVHVWALVRKSLKCLEAKKKISNRPWLWKTYPQEQAGVFHNRGMFCFQSWTAEIERWCATGRRRIRSLLKRAPPARFGLVRSFFVLSCLGAFWRVV